MISALEPSELIVDLFAGGGGASEGIFHATGRHPDVAINHDADAIAVHTRNHPDTLHHCASVWNVNPRDVMPERPIGLLWASPDCRHFSRAAGGGPKSKSVRSLPGVVLTWATRRRPRLIVVENVREMLGWGPLLVDGTPCPARIGRSFNVWVGRLRGLGYQVQWRELCAADFGAPTIRTRLVIMARLDGAPIVWPHATHSRRPSMLELPWRPAAECIDWTLPCPSIFTRKRPLKPATLRRVAEGVSRYVVQSATPFIVRMGHCSEKSGQGMGFRGQDPAKPLSTVTTFNDKAIVVPHVSAFYKSGIGAGADEPLRTITAHGEHHAIVAATLAKFQQNSQAGQPLDEALHTVMAGATRFGLVAAHLSPLTHNGRNRGSDLADPVPTVTCAHRGEQAIIAAMIAQHNGGVIGRAAGEPLSTITTGGCQQQLVAATLSEEDAAGAERVAAFLIQYYGQGRGASSLQTPLGAVTTRDRFALVTVAGVQLPIVDIGMRMLTPRELQAAQGFPDAYDMTDGGRLSKTAQVRLIGNSVCPPMAAAVIRANLGAPAVERVAA